MAEARIPVTISGVLLGTIEKTSGRGENAKTVNIARVLVPVAGDMPETVDIRGWPKDAPVKVNQNVSFAAVIAAWSMDGRSGLTVKFVSLFAEPASKGEKVS